MDQSTVALQCALLAARLNGFHSTSAADLSSDAAEADAIAAFERGCRRDGAVGPPEATGPRIWHAPFDWNLGWHSGPSFDVVICSDVLYNDDAAVPLAHALYRMLQPDAAILLTDPPARAPEHRSAFLRCLGDHDASLRIQISKIVTTLRGEVQVMWLRRGLAADTVGTPLKQLEP